MAAAGSEHLSAATNNMAGGEWQWLVEDGWDGWMKQSSHVTSVWGSPQMPSETDIIKCAFP